jgi:hypothetical protein
MLSDIKFSLPIWPGLSPAEIENDFYPFLEEYGSLLHDLYYTCRIAPFNSDAMGGIIISDEVGTVMSNAQIISETYGIPLSATFNNIMVSPSHPNYRTFIKNFRPIYDKGVRTITIPHTSWLRFGLKTEFPDLFVKNTILNRVANAAEIARLFEEGFDYINLDRELMRNEDVLKEIHEAKLAMEKKLGKKLYISLLYNEMCEGYCPVHPDHYGYNLNRTIDEPAYFNSEMGPISSCIVNDHKSALYILKAASVPSYYSHIDHISQYVNVFKMHGRESKSVFYDSMKIIKQFANRELIDDPYRKILSKISKKERDAYLNQIKNCKFNCWKCKVCDVIATRIEK